MLLKVIACEIALRELYFTAARSPQMVDLEFLTQGHHDLPSQGREEVQRRVDAVPAGKYDAILLGYGLCSNIVAGLTTAHTPLVIPRAHDCITFFLGSKERYQHCFTERPGTYYYTSGWLECAKRRGQKSIFLGGASVPANLSLDPNYQTWVEKFGEDQARYLLEEMGRWAHSYSHGTLIDFDFVQHLNLRAEVQQICADKGWQYDEIPGNLDLLQKMLDGNWPESEFLIVRPGQKVVATFDDNVIGSAPASPPAPPAAS